MKLTRIMRNLSVAAALLSAALLTVPADASYIGGGSGSSGGGTPGGSSGQIQINSAGSFGGFTLGGDCSFSSPNITCNKTGGVSFAPSATTDTTSATNITSGTLPTGQLSGSYTGVTGVGTLTTGTWNGSVVTGQYGGTGVNNGSHLATFGNNLTTAGSNNPTIQTSDPAYSLTTAAQLTSTLAGLKNMVFPDNGSPGITLAAGTYAFSSAPLGILEKYGNNGLTIRGASPVTHSLSSIVSSTGSAGNWSIVLQLDSNSGITANQDYIGITNASGGSNPTRMNGVFKVTNVGASNQITVTSLNRAAAAPSGAVTGTINDLSSTLTFANSDGVEVWNQAVANLDYITIVGDGSSNNGLSIQDTSRLYVPHMVFVYGFGGVQVLELYNSQINGGTILASGGNTGFQPKRTSALDIIGVASGASRTGFSANENSSISLQGSGSGATGNGTEGVQADATSYIGVSSGYSNDNGDYGYYSSRFGYIDQGSNSGNTTNPAYYGAEQIGEISFGQDTNAIIKRSAAADASGDLVLQTFGSQGIDFIPSGGVQLGSPTGGLKGNGTINFAGYTFYNNGGNFITSNQYYYVGTDGNAEIYRNSGLELQTFGGNPILLVGNGTVQHGADAAGSPTAQSDTVGNVSSGTADTAGSDRTFKGSRGTGVGAAGNIIFQTAADNGTTGTSQNALATIGQFGPSVLGSGSTKSFFTVNGTWNDASTTFKGGLLVNITNTSSNIASLLADFQVDGTSELSVTRAGLTTTATLAAGVVKGGGTTSSVLVVESTSGAGATDRIDFKTGSQSIFMSADTNGLVTLPKVGSDATHTDASICEDTTTHALYSGSGTLGVCLGTSTRAAKDHINPLTAGLSEVLALQADSFTYRPGHGYDPSKLYYGFMAEDVQPILPKLVPLKDGAPQSVDLLGMVPVAIHAIQQEDAKVEALRVEYETKFLVLTGELVSLRATIANDNHAVLTNTVNQ